MLRSELRATESNGCTRPFKSTGILPNSLTWKPSFSGAGASDDKNQAAKQPVKIHGSHFFMNFLLCRIFGRRPWRARVLRGVVWIFEDPARLSLIAPNAA